MSPIPITQSVSVSTTFTAIGSPIPLNGVGRDVSLSITNTGSSPLTAFKIQRQFTDNGPWVDWLANGDFDTATTKCSASGGASGNKVYSLTAGNTAWLDFNPGTVTAIQFVASASSATTLQITGGARLDGN